MARFLARQRKFRWPALRGLAQLRRDEGGSTVLEFAFVGPPFIVMVTGILYIALAYLAQDGLETAAEEAGRLMLTGEAQTATYNGQTGLSEANYLNLICYGGTITNASGSSVVIPKILPAFLTCNNLSVNVQPLTSYAATDSGLPTYNCYGTVCNSASSPNATASAGSSAIAGMEGQPTMVQMVYNWTTIAGLFGLGSNTGTTHFTATSGHMKLVATSVFTTEQYTCASGQTSC